MVKTSESYAVGETIAAECYLGRIDDTRGVRIVREYFLMAHRITQTMHRVRISEKKPCDAHASNEEVRGAANISLKLLHLP